MPSRLRWFVGFSLLFSLNGFQVLGDLAGELAGGNEETVWEDRHWLNVRLFVLAISIIAFFLAHGVFRAQAWLRPMILIAGFIMFAISDHGFLLISCFHFGILVAWPCYVFYFDPDVKAWFQPRKQAVAPAHS